MRNLSGAVAVFAAGAALRFPAFARPILSDDEAIYAVTADAMRRGDLLYRDVVDHKPPFIYHLYRAGYRLFGEYNLQGVHLFVLLAVLLTAFFLGKTAAAGRGGSLPDGRRLGLAAAALYLVFSTTWHDYDALAANCELFLLAPQAAAAWLLLRTHRPGVRGRTFLLGHLGVGILVGLSAMLKYQGLTFLGVGAGLMLFQLACGRLRPALAAAALVVMSVGAALPAAGYLAWAASLGNAQAALYWFRFNFSYVGAGLRGTDAVLRGLWRVGIIGGVAAVPYLLGIVGAVRAARRVWRAWRARSAGAGAGAGGDHPTADLLALLWLVTGAIAVATGGRFFGHYFHLVLAPLCLLAAPELMARWDRARWWRVTLVTLCLVPALIFVSLATFARKVHESWDHRDPPYAEVAAQIAALTERQERIFVWGNSPQLYLLSRRPMGTRFSFCNYLTGESPGTPTETGARDAGANVLGEGWRMLFEDLERRTPALLVDVSAAGWDGYDKYPLGDYPDLARYVDRHYRRDSEVAGVVFYRRRSP